jgi:hypothetical protein
VDEMNVTKRKELMKQVGSAGGQESGGHGLID